MPRPLRVHIPGAFYHATLRGNHQEPVFSTDGDRELLGDVTAQALEMYGARIHAYCWMTNHIHLLVEIGIEPLGAVIRQIASVYARQYQWRMATTGHLFERRYYARMVDVDNYLFAALRYIHLNPVDARLCKSPDEYRWSSHHAYSGRTAERWLTTNFVLSMFAPTHGRAIAAYRRFMECAPENDEHSSSHVKFTDDRRSSTPKPVQDPVGQSKHRQSVQELINEACQRFEVTIEQLRSSSRDTYLMQVRGWIANQALLRRVANLSEVARAVGRDRSSLRNSMRRYPDEVS